MFTWNFRYISKARLEETFNQLMLNTYRGDILIRIHTAIHTEEEAVDLARFIKRLAPGAHIFGTSTSAVINRGKLMRDRCVISVTQLSRGRVKTAMVPPLTRRRTSLSRRKRSARTSATLWSTRTRNCCSRSSPAGIWTSIA